MGDFDAQPIGTLEVFVFILKLDFGNDQSGVVTGEFIDFPKMGADPHQMPDFFNASFAGKAHQLFGIGQGNRVLEFEAAGTGLPRFDIEVGGFPADPDPDRALLAPR